MIWSGLLIYWSYSFRDAYKIQFGKTVIFQFFSDWFNSALHLDRRLAEGLGWHFAVMWIFMVNGLLYVAYVGFSQEWKHLVPARGAVKEAIQVVLYDLKLSKTHPPVKKFNAAQQFAYCSIIVAGAGSMFTGLAIYKPVQLAWLTWAFGGYETARLIHFILTLGYLGFFVIHVAQVVRAGWNNFRSMITGYEVIKKA